MHARVAAGRAAVGDCAILRVDCHWRLDESSAAHVIAACAEPGVDWVECPLPENPGSLDALTRLRAGPTHAA